MKTTKNYKEIAFEKINKELDFLMNYFNRRINQATESDFYKLNGTKQKLEFLEKLMTMD